MKIKVLTCDEMNFKEGDKLYKITGLVNSVDIQNVIQICYSKQPCLPEQEYNVKLVASNDMKSLKCNIQDLVKNTDKGIFNK